MLTLIITILILILIGCVIAYRTGRFDEDTIEAVSIISVIILIFFVIPELFLLQRNKEIDYINDTIKMYSEENSKIETQIDNIVKNYMSYENKTVTAIAPKSGIQLVTLYPQLKSDKLVQNQMKIYLDNNNKIKDSQQQQIDGRIYKWWLYFG